MPGGSTTGMFSHLSVHHPEVYREAKDQQLAYKPRLDPRPIDLSGRVLAAPPPLLPHPHVSHVFPVPQVVAVKPLEPRHVQLSVFPFLSFFSLCAAFPFFPSFTLCKNVDHFPWNCNYNYVSYRLITMYQPDICRPSPW